MRNFDMNSYDNEEYDDFLTQDYFLFAIYIDNDDETIMHIFKEYGQMLWSIPNELWEQYSEDGEDKFDSAEEVINIMSDGKNTVKYLNGTFIKIFDSNSDWNDVVNNIKKYLSGDSDDYKFSLAFGFVMQCWKDMLKIKNAPSNLFNLLVELKNIFINIDFLKEFREELIQDSCSKMSQSELLAFYNNLDKIRLDLKQLEPFIINNYTDFSSYFQHTYFCTTLMKLLSME